MRVVVFAPQGQSYVSPGHRPGAPPNRRMTSPNGAALRRFCCLAQSTVPCRRSATPDLSLEPPTSDWRPRLSTAIASRFSAASKIATYALSPPVSVASPRLCMVFLQQPVVTPPAKSCRRSAARTSGSRRITDRGQNNRPETTDRGQCSDSGSRPSCSTTSGPIRSLRRFAAFRLVSRSPAAWKRLRKH